MQIAFEHEPDDGLASGKALGDDIFPNHGLSLIFFHAVAMGAIHHDGLWQPLFDQFQPGLFNSDGVVVWPLSPSQDDVAPRIAGRFHDTRRAFLIDSQETLGGLRRKHRIDGRGHIPIGTVLEAYRHGEAAGHFPVGLRFNGACSHRGPAD